MPNVCNFRHAAPHLQNIRCQYCASLLHARPPSKDVRLRTASRYHLLSITTLFQNDLFQNHKAHVHVIQPMINRRSHHVTELCAARWCPPRGYGNDLTIGFTFRTKEIKNINRQPCWPSACSSHCPRIQIHFPVGHSAWQFILALCAAS